MEVIAALFNVTRQRVSALLRYVSEVPSPPGTVSEELASSGSGAASEEAPDG